MARRPTGQVIEPNGQRQRSWAIRFRAYGERRFVTLGRPRTAAPGSGPSASYGTSSPT